MGSWSAARLGTTRGRCEQTHVAPGRGMRGEEGLCQAAVRSFSWCAIRGVGYGLLSLQMKDALNGNIAFKLLIDSKSEYALLHKEIWNQNSSWVLKANSNLLRKKAQFCLPRWNVVNGNRKTAQPVCVCALASCRRAFCKHGCGHQLANRTLPSHKYEASHLFQGQESQSADLAAFICLW